MAQNTFDMLTILSAAGMAVDRKIYASFGQYANPNAGPARPPPAISPHFIPDSASLI